MNLRLTRLPLHSHYHFLIFISRLVPVESLRFLIMRFSQLFIFTSLAPSLIMAAAIPKMDNSETIVLPRTPAASQSAPATLTRSIRIARHIQPATEKSTIVKREAALNVQFASNPASLPMRHAVRDTVEPHMLARHNEYFDSLQSRSFMPMIKIDRSMMH